VNSDIIYLDIHPSLSVPETLPNNSIQPAIESTITSPNTTISTIRQNFKFNPEQKQIMLDKFNAGLHYPTNPEKDSLAQMFGVSSDSVSHLSVYSF
jgi:hypothetical protein